MRNGNFSTFALFWRDYEKFNFLSARKLAEKKQKKLTREKCLHELLMSHWVWVTQLDICSYYNELITFKTSNQGLNIHFVYNIQKVINPLHFSICHSRILNKNYQGRNNFVKVIQIKEIDRLAPILFSKLYIFVTYKQAEDLGNLL